MAEADEEDDVDAPTTHSDADDRTTAPPNDPREAHEKKGKEGLATSLGLGDSDILQNVYEGGFKSWEGAHDLALMLLNEYAENYTMPGHIVEVSYITFACVY